MPSTESDFKLSEVTLYLQPGVTSVIFSDNGWTIIHN